MLYYQIECVCDMYTCIFDDADNEIKAKTFLCDLTESDIDSRELGEFTFIGKKVLKRLLRQVRMHRHK